MSLPDAPAPADVATRYASICARISTAASLVGRSGRVALTAVSKQQPWDAVLPILRLGQRVFGENRVQEAQSRWRDVAPPLELRLIGPLQTNKAAEAAALFQVIETLDRERLAQAIARAVQAQAHAPRLYVQVNTGEEPQKAGVIPNDVDAFIQRLRTDYDLPIEGLMCIPPVADPPGPHFALLAKIAARNGLTRLSMGMSEDFETAIRFGATDVRVGSALFGERTQARRSTEAPAASPESRA